MHSAVQIFRKRNDSPVLTNLHPESSNAKKKIERLKTADDALFEIENQTMLFILMGYVQIFNFCESYFEDLKIRKAPWF